MPLACLSDTERAAALAQLPQWRLARDGRAIARSFVFADFNAAFAFMTRVALLAEQLYRAWSITQNHPYHRV